MTIWDDPELQIGGDFVKFDNEGDTISGTINAIRAHRFDDGKTAAQLLLTTDTGEERTVTAGQIRLKMELALQRPEVGNHITITYTRKEQRAGGKTLKHFDVKVSPGRGAPAAAPAQTAPQGNWAAPAQTAPQAAPAPSMFGDEPPF